MTPATGYGRVRWDGHTVVLDFAGARVPPGYEIAPAPFTLRDAVVAYTIEPAPGAAAAELRRRYPGDPHVGDSRIPASSEGDK